MIPITYRKGDATLPDGKGHKIICHVCNDVGGWGAGFVLAISKRWKHVEMDYRKAYGKEPLPKLGEVIFSNACVDSSISQEVIVANMIAQRGVRTVDGVPPIRYESVRACFKKVRNICDMISKSSKASGPSIHMPRIGCGLAGGNWPEIENIITEELSQHDWGVFVYDFEDKNSKSYVGKK